ncbi:protein TIFY 6A-like [Silene latifolia]|uniref:protein TIFY 6A-like n=1 Tax=Silene latifolia TaxID=37657 RepID=UPI003D78887A
MKGSSMQWSFSNMASPLVSFKSAEEQQRGVGNQRSYPPHFQQGGSQYPISSHHWHQNDLPPMNHPSDGRVFPGSGQTSQTMYHLPGKASNLRTSTMGGASVSPANGPVVGSTELRSSPSISTGPCQLTIFYNGSVCVYDNVSPDKAQAIMLLAGNGDSAKPKTIPIALSSAPKLQPPLSHMPPTDHPIVTQPPMPKLPHTPPPLLTNHTTTANLPQSNDSLLENEQPLSVRLPLKDTSISNQGVRLTTSISPVTQSPLVASTSGSELTSVKPVLPSLQPNFLDPFKPDTSVGATGLKSAVPQARKASLARFLEKRKERVIDVSPYDISPYSASKKTYECDSIGFGPNFITNTSISKKQLDTIESRT